MPGLEDDLRAAMAADRELGGDYERAVVRSLAERLDSEIDRRVAERVRAAQPRDRSDLSGLVLAIASIGMALGVPSAMHDHVGAGATFVLTLFAWAAIAAINVAYLRRGR